MEQTLTAEEFIKGCEHDGSYIPVKEVLRLMESYAQQTREEEQAKTKKIAFEAWLQALKKHHGPLSESGFTKWFNEFTKKQGGSEQQKCVECGHPMQKKEIIIKGDEDTCDECLCPE